MRLFAAVWPSRDAADRIEGLARPGTEGLRWTTRDQWHVTLAFFGDVEEPRVEEMAAGLGSALAGVAVADVSLGPSTSRIGRSVLCLRAEGLGDLASAVRDAPLLTPAGGSAERFVGHLTLARAKGGRSIPASLCGVELEARWRAEEVCLVRSHLDRSGTRYSVVAREALVRPGAHGRRDPTPNTRSLLGCVTPHPYPNETEQQW